MPKPEKNDPEKIAASIIALKGGSDSIERFKAEYLATGLIKIEDKTGSGPLGVLTKIANHGQGEFAEKTFKFTVENDRINGEGKGKILEAVKELLYTRMVEGEISKGRAPAFVVVTGVPSTTQYIETMMGAQPKKASAPPR